MPTELALKHSRLLYTWETLCIASVETAFKTNTRLARPLEKSEFLFWAVGDRERGAQLNRFPLKN
jgi:hypothetical protein